MAYDNLDLRSFQHCRKDVDLVCFLLPINCPLCNLPTANTESRIPPYVLPSPFTSSLKSPRSLILKPTHGDFITSYSRACNLHIGITDERGYVYDFDEKGLNQLSVWPECLPVITADMYDAEAWDQALQSVCGHSASWHESRYHEDQWNCFDFVLQFLRQMRHPEVSGAVTMSKAEFCDHYLTKKAKRAEQYIHLYRQALQDGCVQVPKTAS
ncbi:unnamed protein product [Lymnaea stagnalis]|uniref:MKRN2 opposite strand protein-like C-terminal domain-containing protein n=1 Tax=Lymnaea stagnalis TaxID=6523 RepID=A0AAV2HRR7_LYMST